MSATPETNPLRIRQPYENSCQPGGGSDATCWHIGLFVQPWCHTETVETLLVVHGLRVNFFELLVVDMVVDMVSLLNGWNDSSEGTPQPQISGMCPNTSPCRHTCWKSPGKMEEWTASSRLGAQRCCKNLASHCRYLAFAVFVSQGLDGCVDLPSNIDLGTEFNCTRPAAALEPLRWRF